jgi:uncharacterized protein (DUF362 family)
MSPIRKLLHKFRHSFFLFGLASLLWFVLRTGGNPTRISYPCQQASAAAGNLWLASYALPAVMALRRFAGTETAKQGTRNGQGRSLLQAGLMLLLLLLLSSLFFQLGGFAIRSSVQTVQEDVALADQGGDMLTINLSEMRSADAQASSIFAVQGTTGNDDGVTRLIALMQEQGQPFYARNGSPGIIARDDVVIIKVNSQWDQRGGTNSDLVKALVQAILDHPQGFAGEVVIADNGQGQYGSTGHGGSLSYSQNNAEDKAQSMQAVAASFPDQKVSTYLWDTITGKKVGEYAQGDGADGYIVSGQPQPQTGIAVTYPKFRTRFGTPISFKLGVWDEANKTYDSNRLKVLNVPVLKTHSGYGVTASVKHYMGVVSDRLSREAGGRAHNSVGSGGMGTQMAQTRFPDLNILDAIWINAHPRGGPSTSYSEADRAGIIAASTDPVALDAWAARQILMPAARQKGYGDSGSMDPDNASPGSFGEWLGLAQREILNAGHPAAIDEKSMNVYLA